MNWRTEKTETGWRAVSADEPEDLNTHRIDQLDHRFDFLEAKLDRPPTGPRMDPPVPDQSCATVDDMQIRDLSGMQYWAVELTANVATPVAVVLDRISDHIFEADPMGDGNLLHSITTSPDPYSEDNTLYTIVMSAV